MNFNKEVARKNTGSVKWDLLGEFFGDDTILPMWVADMDFDNAVDIKTALTDLVESTVLGYSFPTEKLYQAIIDWQADRHNMTLSQTDILFSPGVLTSLAVCIQALTEVGDGILIHDPVYTPFSTMVTNNNRILYRSPLRLKDQKYIMDFQYIEKQFSTHNITCFILCNPHNPGGRVWSKDELVTLVELCKHYDVILLSDEIHSDLVYKEATCLSPVTLDEGYKDFIVTFHSATKTFNIAGVKASFILVYDEVMRNKIIKVQEQTEVGSVSNLGLCATETAFSKCKDWHDGLMTHLENNRKTICDFFDTHLPHVSYMVPEATYLFWFDASTLNVPNNQLKETFTKVGKIALNDGISYGPTGDCYMRLNFAVPEAMLEDALNRVKKVFDTL